MKSLYISKKNLLKNLSFIKSKSNAKICAVVKANAYGHGIKNICTILKGKVDYFSVANLEEALEIKSFDAQTKVLILGNCSNFVLAAKSNVSVTIFCIHQLKNLVKKLNKINIINIHIKIDTGMNRLGFSTITEFKKVLNIIKKHKNKIIIEGVFTHFATLRNDISYFEKQQNKFERFLKHLKNYDKVLVHAGGSLTSMHLNKYQMIRYGIFLYGYGNKNLKPVLSVKAKPITIKKVGKNQNVGYSKSYITTSPCTIAVLPLGYYDGIPRNFINQNFYYKKQKIKVLNVCMDMTIVMIPENLKPNFTLTVFNNATEWAKILKTNEHDVLVKFNSFRGKKVVK